MAPLAQTPACEISARLPKTTDGTAMENSFSFGSKANAVITSFYRYYTAHFFGECRSHSILLTSAMKQ